ncbi:Hsp70 family protein [Butyrivibrio sp. YAB3001]|uniref:Hsp70 family protein n=1 Tax=Butyrivibrio sp. YAB3001 TaxID=1520812 RepID=UPI0008F65BA4|nr:Hsp70 family protein [Butyrivibrio sp. YAB3001]SFB81658.1 molecular chaperone DnaK [Butyrivibrio sp. YAB3001]
MKAKYECGIDLGTTNSCIAIMNEENKPEVIENNTDRMYVTPSVVQVSRTGRITVGQRAYTYPDGRFVKKEFKRDMGTDTVYEFPESGKKMTPIELSAEVLKVVKRDVEARIGKGVSTSVITVPAAFQELQIKATKEAAGLAGFEQVILLQEPVAAAVAYGAKASDVGENWLVFDYGGGTLDVAVVSTKNGELAAINNKGNNRMGGKDIDRAIYEKIVLPAIKDKYQIVKDLNGQAKAKALFEIEKCKIELSKIEQSIFELFDVKDDNDEEIEFELEITRRQFDEAIEEIVDETIDIARDALIGAHLKDSDITKIILVGGSTYIPLVREKLKEEFKVDLDCSCDPMTVVAMGAAMFASQNYIETADDLDADYQNNGDVIGAEFEYDESTIENNVSIIGRLTNYIPGSVDKIKFSSRENGLWQGGWLELLDIDAGVFEYEVSIYNANGENTYVMSAIDSTGTVVGLNVQPITITYGGGLKLAAPPLPFNMGIMTADGSGNIVDWLLRKNTRLPSTGRGNYRLNKTLNPKEEDVFTLKVYEGEDTYNPEANHLIGDIKVNSKDLPRALIEGEEVEITIDVDISRVVTVSAYIPKFDFILTEEKIMGGQTQYTSFSKEIEKARDEIQHAKGKIEKLKNEGNEVDDFSEKLEKIKQKSEELDDQFDNDDAQNLLDNLRKLESEIIKKERDTKENTQNKQELQRISQVEKNIAQYGNESDRKTFENLKNRYLAEKNDSIREHFFNKINELNNKVFWSSFEWQKEEYYRFYKDNKNARYKDEQKANYWNQKAYEAILNEDKEGLKNALNSLKGLEIRDDSKKEEQNDQADIRI